ncbi:hypothetical protein [Actinoalloteichus hoggarensis]|nr:hypothetical protein [Actinoalloteichus hoggarensis]
MPNDAVPQDEQSDEETTLGNEYDSRGPTGGVNLADMFGPGGALHGIDVSLAGSISKDLRKTMVGLGPAIQAASEAARPLRLADMFGPGGALHGIDVSLAGGKNPSVFHRNLDVENFFDIKTMKRISESFQVAPDAGAEKKLLEQVPTNNIAFDQLVNKVDALIEGGLASEVSSTEKKLASKGISLPQASSMIGTALLLQVSIVLYVGARDWFEAVSQIFGFPANLIGALALILAFRGSR